MRSDSVGMRSWGALSCCHCRVVSCPGMIFEMTVGIPIGQSCSKTTCPKYHASPKAAANISSAISSDESEVELQNIGQGCNPFRSARVLAHDNGIAPAKYILLYPASDQRFCMEIVDRLAEETLTRWSLSD